MNKALLIVCILFTICQTAFAEEGVDKAKITGTITDFKSIILAGEVILFENKSTKKVYTTTSDANGKFKISLACGASYLIKIKGFKDVKDYTELAIPALEPNQLNASFEINIKYEPSKEFTLDNVYFDSGKASLTKNSYKELSELVSYLNVRKSKRIEIAGHTDNVGESDNNLILSQKRANTIVQYLIIKGINAKRLKAVGYGEDYPIGSNETKAGRKLNRRTEVRAITNPSTK